MNLDALEARAEAMEESWGAEGQWVQPEELKPLFAEVRRLRLMEDAVDNCLQAKHTFCPCDCHMTPDGDLTP